MLSVRAVFKATFFHYSRILLPSYLENRGINISRTGKESPAMSFLFTKARSKKTK
jgi:hypothetical protein